VFSKLRVSEIAETALEMSMAKKKPGTEPGRVKRRSDQAMCKSRNAKNTNTCREEHAGSLSGAIGKDLRLKQTSKFKSNIYFGSK
jgi:hypothetical protein